MAPIYREFYVTHASDSYKLHNGGKIIEVKIDSENDIQAIIENGFIESNKHSYGIDNEEGSKITFWGFKTNMHYPYFSIIPFQDWNSDGNSPFVRNF